MASSFLTGCFTVISSGVDEDYDAFTLEIVIGEGCVNRLVEVKVDGKKSTDAGGFGGHEVGLLAKQLLENAENRK